MCRAYNCSVRYVLHTLKRKFVTLKVAEKVNTINEVIENLKDEIANKFLIFCQTKLKNKTDILHKYKSNKETLQNMFLKMYILNFN